MIVIGKNGIPLFFVLFLMTGPVFAQRTTASIYGLIKDTSGGIVPGVTVQLTNDLTGVRRQTVTDGRGEFVVTFLPVGSYSLRAEAKGFKPVNQRGLELVSGQDIRHYITLEVGDLSQQVEVTAEPPLLQNASVQLSGRVTVQQVEELPASRRDFTRLLTLQTGVVRSSTELFQINGLASAGISVTVDGVDAAGDSETPSVSLFQGQNFINVVSREAISEVNVSKGVISAEVGRAYSGNINVITKGGTNELHGSLFENWQNDVLNARFALLDPSARKPPMRFHQFGGSVGGPVIRDKAFFFVAYEAYRQSNMSIQNGLVPTPEFKAQAIRAVPAYQAVLDQFPAPTDSYPSGASSALWRGPAFDKADDNHLVFRGDYNLRSADRLSARWTRGRPDRIVPRPLISNQRRFTYATDSANASWVHAAPSWTSETRVGFNFNSAIRLDDAYETGLPGIEIQAGNFAVGAEKQLLSGHTYSIEEVFAKTIGLHTVKFGGIHFVQAPGRFNEETPVFRYANPAAFLSNTPNRVQFTFGVPRFFGRSWQLAGFIQDDLKLRPNLTLNLGLRYEYYSVFKDKDGNLLNAGTPANAYASPPRFLPADSAYKGDFNNFLPRVGFSWSPGSQAKTVIRSGFGVTVGPQNLRHFYTLVAYDPKIVFRYRFTGSDITQLNLRYPLTNAQAIDRVRTTNVARSFEIFDKDNPNPYTMQWTFDIQRQLSPTTVLQTGYVGTKGLKISMSHNINLQDRLTGIRPVPSVLESQHRDASDVSIYHAWQTSLRQRLTRDITFNINHTYSKAMAIAAGDYWGGNDPEVQDENNFRADWGPLDQDRTHTFTTDFIYTAPFDRWVGASGLVKHVIGGWQFSGIFSAATGSPLTIVQVSNYPFSRPDYIGGNPYSSAGDHFLFLNSAAFANVPNSRVGLPIRPGNLGKNPLRGPGRWDVDFSITKNFELVERYKLQLRADMFNAMNHVNLTNPVTDITRRDFGRINSVGGPRTIQLAARLTF
jgi:hypothetical protein